MLEDIESILYYKATAVESPSRQPLVQHLNELAKEDF
jgi:hypothetical protein